MKNLFLNTGILIITSAMFFACGKEKCLTPPSVFQMRVENAHNEDMLNPAICPTLKLVYADAKTGNDVPLDLELLEKSDAATDKKIYYLRTAELPWKSLDGNKEFRLYRGNLAPDFLSVDVQNETSGNCTSSRYKSIKFNAQDIITDFDYTIGAYVAKVQ